MPASKQARRPSAAYCELELSPSAGPSRVFRAINLRTTLGRTRRPSASSFAAVGTGGLAGVGTPFGISVGVPYSHWPFRHWLSTRNCAHCQIRSW